MVLRITSSILVVVCFNMYFFKGGVEMDYLELAKTIYEAEGPDFVCVSKLFCCLDLDDSLLSDFAELFEQENEEVWFNNGEHRMWALLFANEMFKRKRAKVLK